MVLPTTPFRLERDMLNPLIRSITTVLNIPMAGEGRLLQEPPIGSVIPDVMVGIWPDRERSAPRPRFSFRETHILGFLERIQSAKCAAIAKALYCTEREVAKAVTRLARVGAVIRADDGTISVAESYRTANLQIIAIEAKLRRWREALRQAESYTCFADRAYVVLDGNQVRLTSTIRTAFETAGIGLLLQHGSVVRRVVEAQEFRPISAARVRAADKLWSSSELPVQ